MRADRLLSILLLLQNRGRMTARDLATQLEVSERTIYRDIEALSISGVPIFAERGPGGGCSLLNGYQTRLTGLTEAEVQALFLINTQTAMARPLADLGLDRNLEEALLKLSAALPAAQRDDAERMRRSIHLDMTGSEQCEKDSLHLRTIQDALWHECKLCLVSTIGNDTYMEQLVEPYGLVSKANAWYLVGASDGEKQVYPLSGIMSATMSSDHFVRPTDFDLQCYWATYTAHMEQRKTLTAAHPSVAHVTQKQPISIAQRQTQSQHRQRQTQAKKTVSPPSIHQQYRPAQQKKQIPLSFERDRVREKKQHRPLQQKKQIILIGNHSLSAQKKPNLSHFAYLLCA
jgi:predicted DNA-binding transcriptional regulator YafY